MMKYVKTQIHAWWRMKIIVAAVAVMLAVATASVSAAAPEAVAASSPTSATTRPADEGLVRVGKLVYASGKTGVCFADQFLTTVGRETQINVRRRMEAVDLSSDDLFQYPFVVMSGTGPFTLSPQEVEQLESYLNRGGFLLASAGCSDSAWAASFRAVMVDMWGTSRLQPIGVQHPVLHTLFEIDQLIARKPTATADAALFGLEIGDRLAVVFSPLGLNDTANAGGGCCCCGGNELRQARLINANILAYTLTH